MSDVLPPLLLHLDVNKTVILGDSVQSTTIEDGVRESLAELFWGTVRTKDDEMQWEWTMDKPSCFPPEAKKLQADTELITYSVFCKRKISDKKTRKAAVRNLTLVNDPATKEAMEKIAQTALTSMKLPPELQDSEAAKSVGLNGSLMVMFPALFSLVAKLQQSRRPFSLIFRTFGQDHAMIAREWNAFCEMRHPLFSTLLNEIGPLDGSIPGVPDRRYHGVHTLYRDADGPVLGLNINTNGPEESTWDAWAKQKPKPNSDTRSGRGFFTSSGVSTIDGYQAVGKWVKEFCKAQATAAIKDDWAWWQFNGENSSAGKLLIVDDSLQQMFFDDNVEHDDAHIVDCRHADGTPVPQEESMNRFISKVNPVEAVLDEQYFVKELHRCHGNCAPLLQSTVPAAAPSLRASMTTSEHLSLTTTVPQTLQARSIEALEIEPSVPMSDGQTTELLPMGNSAIWKRYMWHFAFVGMVLIVVILICIIRASKSEPSRRLQNLSTLYDWHCVQEFLKKC